MNRERQYKQLAEDMFRRASKEESAQKFDDAVEVFAAHVISQHKNLVRI